MYINQKAKKSKDKLRLDIYNVICFRMRCLEIRQDRKNGNARPKVFSDQLPEDAFY